MSRFAIEKTSIHGLHVIQRKPIGDERGYLERLFCNDELEPIIGQRRILQINHTLTAKVGTVRGIHFQHPPHAEMKLVSCLRGEVFDVAVDLRRDSPTFLQWHAEILSEENRRTFCIPEGFAHGFQTLTHDCELIYFHTAAYTPEAEAGLNTLDPLLSISWPMPITERSTRDQNHAMLTLDFSGLPV
jgi:dTDP-4-dehydrorhamnose 3,5-epimerase